MSFDYVLKTTEDFRALSPEKRRCLFPQELELDIFPEYSEANCVLECAWRLASERCQCVPWFLKPQFPKAVMCEAFGNRCFRHLVDNRYKEENPCSSQCPDDCETYEFQPETSTREVPGAFVTVMCSANFESIGKALPYCRDGFNRENYTGMILGQAKQP